MGLAIFEGGLYIILKTYSPIVHFFFIKYFNPNRPHSNKIQQGGVKKMRQGRLRHRSGDRMGKKSLLGCWNRCSSGVPGVDSAFWCGNTPSLNQGETPFLDPSLSKEQKIPCES